ncbi:MAG: M42 family metallopeptidase [Deinococcales bacterium]|nr:M42 family metallopeptidase [Deinococcales bacterium]
MDSSIELLKKLSEAAGVPSREEQVREIVRQELEGKVDELTVDAMGNLVAIKRSGRDGAPRVMVAAHMDEIGFLVRHVDDRGFLRVQSVGGFDTRNLFARQVTVHASKSGEELIGVMNPAGKPIHISTAEERKKIPTIDSFYIDLGLEGDAVKEKVRVGDMVTLRQEFVDLGTVVTGKALDDRSGCWILIETIKRLQQGEMGADLHAVFTVQEEVGLRGAITGAYAAEADVGVALDTTLAVDTPEIGEHLRVTQLGKGVGLKVMDSSIISTRWLLDHFMELAEANGIDYQLEVLPLGGNDAAAIQKSRGGIPSITLSTPSRYVHTVTEMVAKSDLEGAVALLTRFLQEGVELEGRA